MEKLSPLTHIERVDTWVFYIKALGGYNVVASQALYNDKLPDFTFAKYPDRIK